MSASYQKGEAVAVNLCTCSFCNSLAGNASFFADNPAALTEPSSFGDAPFADLAAAISMVANTPIFADGPAAKIEAIGSGASFTVFAGALSLVANPQTAQAGASSTAVTAGAPAVATWVNTLTTPSIKTDMIAADINGTVSEANLRTLFSDVASSLGAGKLTAAQFADLKTIAANLNNGMTASPISCR